MLEVHRVVDIQGSKLLVPKKEQLGKPLTNEDVAEMFGANYRQLIEDKARRLGILGRLNFFDTPTPHDGSQAMYLVEQFVGDDLILVPVLQKGMQTSQHYHVEPMLKEIYFHIAGGSTVHVGADETPFPLNEKYPVREIPLGLSHQVKAPECPALTLIVMENARLVPPGRLHVKHLK